MATVAVAEGTAVGRLNDLLERLSTRVPFYAQRIGNRRVRSLEDFVELPLTTRDDFRDSYPYGLFAVPDTLQILVEAGDGADPDHLPRLARERIRETIRLECTVTVVGAGILPRFEGRASRVVDRRKIS
jgi:phenylacetate-coenzyme A ligase PaaK-like adenylate-forming protein